MNEMSATHTASSSPSASELLRNVVESVKDVAIVAMDIDGHVTYWNIGAERMLGFTEDEMLGKSADIFFVPEDLAKQAAEEERRLAGTHGSAEDERWHMRKDGSRFWGSGVMTLLSEGAPGFVKILRDLTERRTAQERLRDSEHLFRSLATNIPQLVFRTRGSGERTWGSPQWIIFTGLSFQDSLGYGWLAAVHSADRERTLDAWDVARQTGVYSVQHRIQRVAQGEYRWHQTRANPVDPEHLDDDWVGTSTDVHDLHTLQERQKVLLGELQHRTRNLLAVVQSMSRQTIRSSDSLGEFQTEFESRLRALSRVQGLLAKFDHGAIDLRSILDAELAALADGSFHTDKVQLHGPSALLPATSAQAIALAVHELATNALKYGAFKEASGRLKVHWHIEKAAGTQRQVVLTWEETGVPLHAPPERQGYGTELIQRALPYQLNAKTSFEFHRDGVRCQIATAIVEGS